MRPEQEQLWTACREGAEWARDELLACHARLVYREAGKSIQRHPHGLELDDLVGAGMVGLVEAVDGFDPDRGLAFSTYALPRIRGSMLDQMRKWDPLSRSARRRERLLCRGREELSSALERAPTDPELADHLAVDVVTLDRWRRDAMRGRTLSLDGPAAAGDHGTRTLEEVIPAGEGGACTDALNHAEEVALLEEAIADLPERDRQVLSLYYMEDLTLREIGDLLGVTESRVCQIRSAALDALRDHLGYLRVA